MKKQKIIFIEVIAFFICISFANALTITDVSYSDFSPGEEKLITIKIENNLGEDVTDVYIGLVFTGKPFIPVGSSEDSADEILDDDNENFKFKIKASNDIKPGDYEIPYKLNYKDESGIVKQATGSIGVSVSGNPELDFVLLKENPVVGQKGKITLKIINSGFGDAKFVSVKLIPAGFTLLSEDQIYIGSINSDDFETAVFEVIFKQESTIVSAVVDYTDFDNKKITKNVNLPLDVYSKERAIELGIIKKSNTLFYLILLIIFGVVWWVYRIFKKRARLRKAREMNGK